MIIIECNGRELHENVWLPKVGLYVYTFKSSKQENFDVCHYGGLDTLTIVSGS